MVVIVTKWLSRNNCSLLVHVHHPYPMHIDNSWCSVACARLPTNFHINEIVQHSQKITYRTDNTNQHTSTKHSHNTNYTQIRGQLPTASDFKLIYLEVVGPHHLGKKPHCVNKKPSYTLLWTNDNNNTSSWL